MSVPATMTVNGMHGWPNGWVVGELHELACVEALCRCETVYAVREPAEQGVFPSGFGDVSPFSRPVSVMFPRFPVRFR